MPPVSERVRDAAVLLPALGVVLLMPPVVALFATDVHVFGVPLVVAWLFGAWLALIGCAAWLSRRLPATPVEDPGERSG